MSWLRLDDGYDTHPKLLELTEQQRWRWTRVLIHCARHQTQGHVKASVLRELGLARAVQQLLHLGLLESNGDAGYLVHDWTAFNPKDPTKTERQARWRAKQASTSPSPVDASVDDDVDSPTVHSRAGTPARPVPSRPLDQNPVTETVVQDAGSGNGEIDPDEINRILADAAVKDMPQ